MSSMDLKLAWCAALLTRIIDAAEFFAGGLDDLATMGGGLDIAGPKHSLAPGLPQRTVSTAERHDRLR
jgi:hypothetical protein